MAGARDPAPASLYSPPHHRALIRQRRQASIHRPALAMVPVPAQNPRALHRPRSSTRAYSLANLRPPWHAVALAKAASFLTFYFLIPTFPQQPPTFFPAIGATTRSFWC